MPFAAKRTKIQRICTFIPVSKGGIDKRKGLIVKGFGQDICNNNFGINVKWISLAAIASQIWWYVMALCFFFKADDGIVVLITTLLLSPNIKAEPSMGTPIICRVLDKLHSLVCS